MPRIVALTRCIAGFVRERPLFTQTRPPCTHNRYRDLLQAKPDLLLHQGTLAISGVRYKPTTPYCRKIFIFRCAPVCWRRVEQTGGGGADGDECSEGNLLGSEAPERRREIVVGEEGRDG